MRRKERSGPVIMNSEEAATGPSCGDDVAAASDGFETATPAKSSALAGKQQQAKTETTTRVQKQRGDFTAGFLSEPARPHATGVTARRAEIVIHPRNRVMSIPGLVIPGSWFQIPMSAKITYLSRLSKQFRQFLGRFSFAAWVSGKWAVLPRLA